VSDHNDLSSKRLQAKLFDASFPVDSIQNRTKSPENLVESLPEKIYNRDLFIGNNTENSINTSQKNMHDNNA